VYLEEKEKDMIFNVVIKKLDDVKPGGDRIESTSVQIQPTQKRF
jgi:hypothetical protein